MTTDTGSFLKINGHAQSKTGSGSTPRGAQPRAVITVGDAERDLDAIEWSMGLSQIRRYFHQKFWERETDRAEYAALIEPEPRLENVAEHSWHVADTILILAPRFPEIRIERAVCLAVLHDKMEISIGDWNPVGKDGTGSKTHAFAVGQRLRKSEREAAAIEDYVARLHPAAGRLQREMLLELLAGESDEARFVKAVDKLQALVFVVNKKAGTMTDTHLRFTMRYSQKVMEWQGLQVHLQRLRERLFRSIANRRGVDVARVRQVAYPDQLTLFDV